MTWAQKQMAEQIEQAKRFITAYVALLDDLAAGDGLAEYEVKSREAAEKWLDTVRASEV